MKLAASGRIRVPEFQRSFVWDGDDVRKLFDSIWRGFPIGTLLLWKKTAPEGIAHFGPLPLTVPASTEAYWVVDGQQRVTSILGAFTEAGPAHDPRFDLCFDLRRARFVHAGKRPNPAWWVPLNVTLESRTLLNWLRADGQGLSPEELDLADALGGALRDYRIPAYVVEHDDEELLREVFDRVNSAGKRISRAQVFHALFASGTEPGSPASVVAALEHEGFGTLEEDRIVQSLLAIRGGDVQRDLHDEFERNENLAQWYDETERALSRSIRFLKQQGVPHLLLVPSTLPLPVLAAFFYLHPDPEPWNEQLLARWVWRGWVHGFGRSGQTPALRQAIRSVNPTKRNVEQAPSEFEAVKSLLGSVPDEPAPKIDVDHFRTAFALGRLSLIALATLEPRDPSGEAIDIAEVLNKYKIKAITDLVPGQRTRLGARGFWPVGASRPTGHEAEPIRTSHAISDDAAEALREKDIEGFVQLRGNHVAELTRRFLIARLQRKSPVRPPLSELLVSDE